MDMNKVKPKFNDWLKEFSGKGPEDKDKPYALKNDDSYPGIYGCIKQNQSEKGYFLGIGCIIRSYNDLNQIALEIGGLDLDNEDDELKKHNNIEERFKKLFKRFGWKGDFYPKDETIVALPVDDTDWQVKMKAFLAEYADLRGWGNGNKDLQKNIDNAKIPLSEDEKDSMKLIENGIHQIIFTGAPGTGKTYSAKRIAERMGGTILNNQGEDVKYELAQFHPSYDYTDFVEGLRPVDDGNGGMKFVKLDGTFKAFCRQVAKKNEELGDDKTPYFFIKRPFLMQNTEMVGVKHSMNRTNGTAKYARMYCK